jgi:hypothetical protein
MNVLLDAMTSESWANTSVERQTCRVPIGRQPDGSWTSSWFTEKGSATPRGCRCWSREGRCEKGFAKPALMQITSGDRRNGRKHLGQVPLHDRFCSFRDGFFLGMEGDGLACCLQQADVVFPIANRKHVLR